MDIPAFLKAANQTDKMTEESKVVDSELSKEAVKEALEEQSNASTVNDESDDEEPQDSSNPDAVAASSASKKKKSKKAKIKKVFGAKGKEDGSTDAAEGSKNPAIKLTPGMVEQLLELNPSLKSEVAGMDAEKAAEALKKLDVADLLTGMVRNYELLLGVVILTRWTDRERQESEGYGVVQVLADSAGPTIR